MPEKPPGEMPPQSKLDHSKEGPIEETSALDLPISFTVTPGANSYYDLMRFQVRKDGTVVDQKDRPLRSREDIFAALDKASGFLHSEIEKVEYELMSLKDKQKQLALTREFLEQHAKVPLRPGPSGG